MSITYHPPHAFHSLKHVGDSREMCNLLSDCLKIYEKFHPRLTHISPCEKHAGSPNHLLGNLQLERMAEQMVSPRAFPSLIILVQLGFIGQF